MPQDGALFSTMNVRAYLEFSLVVRRWPRAAIRERVDELVEMLGIGHLLDRKLAQLSGGEQQRVALGRVLACHSQLLCLDEPLSALDDETRQSMYELLRRVCDVTRGTTLHITHNRAEAGELAHRLLTIENGRIKTRSLRGATGTSGREHAGMQATGGEL